MPTLHRHLTLAAALFLAACSSAALPEVAGDAGATPDATAPSPDTMAPQATGFELTLSADKLPVLQGTTGQVEVTVTRKPGFTGAVMVSQSGLPAGASLAPVTIASDQTKTTLQIVAAAEAPHSLPTPVTIRGVSGTDEATRSLTVTVHGPPGSLDTSFAGGKVIIPVGSSDDYAYAMAVQADGKVVLAGRSAEHLGDIAVVRLERDGTLDSTFGTGGKVTTDLAGRSETAYAVAVQSDGKIVVAGTTTSPVTKNDFVVVRYTASGALDTGFGEGGKVVTSFSDESDTAWALVIQADGRIVVGGDSNGNGVVPTGLDFALARYNADGALDATFGTGGKVTTSVRPNGGRDSIYALALQTVDGETRIVAAGGEGDFSLARYRADGQLDASFGMGGTLTDLLGSSIGAARAVAVAADGSVVAAGHHTHDFAVVRLDRNGRMDGGFGAGGKVITPVTSSWDEAQGVAIDADGKIVVAGWAFETGSSGNFALVRYDSQGHLDPSFGGTGTVLTPVAAPTKPDQGTAVVLQSDPRVPTVRVLVAGYASGSNSDFAVTRFWR
jgi:uncharacterized delta-60 repeat protein